MIRKSINYYQKLLKKIGTHKTPTICITTQEQANAINDYYKNKKLGDKKSMEKQDIRFKELRQLIAEDRRIKDITTRHNWLIDKWVEYSEKKEQVAINHDEKRHELLFKRNWNKLNEERENDGLRPVISFKERKDYVGLELINHSIRLNEIDDILKYLGTRG